jgi:hypothetical protein
VINAWLERLILKSAAELEQAGRGVYGLTGKIEAILKCRPVQEWEGDRWARGIKRGLVRQEDFFVRAGAGKRGALSLFVHNTHGQNVGLRREAITQMATYISLITDYGYPRAQTRFECQRMDVAVYEDRKRLPAESRVSGGKSARQAGLWLYAENKAADRILEKLCAGLSERFVDTIPYIPAGDDLPHDDVLMKASHIWTHRPRYFWGVAPTRRLAFEVLYSDRGFRLSPVDAIPDADEFRRTVAARRSAVIEGIPF